MQRKWVKFLLPTCWILITRAYDVYATWTFTPDLSREANPLVSIGGLGWTPLLVIIGILIAVTLYGWFLAVFRPLPPSSMPDGLTFGQFLPQWYLGRSGHWFELFYRLPRGWSRSLRTTATLLVIGLSWAGLLSTLMWLGINHSSWYRAWHSVTLIWSLVAGGVIVGFLLWGRLAYRKYRLG